MRFFEDIAVGERLDLGRFTFTAEKIKAFASRFDPQPFHMDEAAAKRSHFGGLCASGWHTASVWMRLLVDFQRREDEVLKAHATEVIETRPSNSRPDWGLITIRNTGTNQRGEPVISFVSVAFVQRRKGRAP